MILVNEAGNRDLSAFRANRTRPLFSSITIAAYFDALAGDEKPNIAVVMANMTIAAGSLKSAVMARDGGVFVEVMDFVALRRICRTP